MDDDIDFPPLTPEEEQAVERLASRDRGLADKAYLKPPVAAQKGSLEQVAAASLAGGIIAASGRPHTIDEAEAVFRAVMDRLYPS